MTRPTSDQLAINVDPLLREYIDARIAEALTGATRDVHVKAASASDEAKAVSEKLRYVEGVLAGVSADGRRKDVSANAESKSTKNRLDGLEDLLRETRVRIGL